jgi:hypothetical protein
MKHFLLKAFEGARTLTTPIINAYDHACFTAMRVYLDHDFLHIKDHMVPHPQLKPVAETFNRFKGVAQNKLLDTVSLKNARGDFSPQPDIKPKLFKLASSILTHMPKVSPTTAAVVTLGIGVGLVAYTLTSQGMGTHVPQNMSDAFATFLGAKPNAAPPAPQNRIA